MRQLRPILRVPAVALAGVLLVACSGGSDSSPPPGSNRGDKPPARGGDAPPGGGSLQLDQLTAWSISKAGNEGTAAGIFEPGDSFVAESDATQAGALWDALWARLSAAARWTGSNPLNSYVFRIDPDPKTNWGRSYVYSGYATIEGPVRTPFGLGKIVGSGTYRRADGRTFEAMVLQTWDDTYWQLFVFVDASTFVSANQDGDGLPILETYTRS